MHWNHCSFQWFTEQGISQCLVLCPQAELWSLFLFSQDPTSPNIVTALWMILWFCFSRAVICEYLTWLSLSSGEKPVKTSGYWTVVAWLSADQSKLPAATICTFFPKSVPSFPIRIFARPGVISSTRSKSGPAYFSGTHLVGFSLKLLFHIWVFVGPTF